MTKLLIKLFVKDYDNVHSTKVREAYGKLAGIVGIISNTLMSLAKIIVGILVNSIAIIADGANNLADASSSVIALVGFKLSAKAGDKEHPYGHARYEYIAGMIISVIIIVVGAELLLSSIEKIREPAPIAYNHWILVVLLLSIGIKIWQSLFNIKIGKTIDSTTLKATGIDSRNDVVATSAVLLSVLIDKFSNVNVDGFMGVLVALFIIYSGVSLIRETSNPLLGQAPDPALVKVIEKKIMSFDNVLGIHDLVVHEYGPGKIFASVHIEVDSRQELLKSHELIDDIESKISNELNIELIGHMDPIDTQDPLVHNLQQLISQIVAPIQGVVSFHDLRIVKGEQHTNAIMDIVVSVEQHDNKEDITNILQEEITKHYPKLKLVIKYDMDYTDVTNMEKP